MTTEGFTAQLSHSADSGDAASMRKIGIAARTFDAASIARELRTMRQWLREFVVELSDAQLQPPLLATINPPLWEAAHVAWFAEWFCVRGAYNTEDGRTVAARASLWPECDAFLNSNLIAHNARWKLPALTRGTTLDYLERSLDATLSALAKASNDDDGLYRFRLAMFHEAMHLEAIAWTAQTLGWPCPAWLVRTPSGIAKDEIRYEARVPFLLGEEDDSVGFRFDNEYVLAPHRNTDFLIMAALVTNGEFAEFVERGDYASAVGPAHPPYWRKRAGHDWELRRFDRWIPIVANEPVVHVSALEAEAYARWRGGRLPTEDELHSHFVSDPGAWHGQVWEWTSSPFAPRGNESEFQPGLYREYSQPWFDGNHRVLRGGSFATLPVMHHPLYRNFFTPERGDVFAGFRVNS